MAKRNKPQIKQAPQMSEVKPEGQELLEEAVALIGNNAEAVAEPELEVLDAVAARRLTIKARANMLTTWLNTGAIPVESEEAAGKAWTERQAQLEESGLDLVALHSEAAYSAEFGKAWDEYHQKYFDALDGQDDPAPMDVLSAASIYYSIEGYFLFRKVITAVFGDDTETPAEDQSLPEDSHGPEPEVEAPAFPIVDTEALKQLGTSPVLMAEELATFIANNPPKETLKETPTSLDEMTLSFIDNTLQRYQEEVAPRKPVTQEHGRISQLGLEHMFNTVIDMARTEPRKAIDGLERIKAAFAKSIKEKGVFSDDYIFRFTGTIPDTQHRNERHVGFLTLMLVYANPDRSQRVMVDMQQLLRYQPTEVKDVLTEYFRTVA